MKKTKFVLLTSVILVLVFALCACDFVIKDFAKYSEAMTKSMDSVTSVGSHITMQDQGVLVYEYQRNMAIDGNNATITTVQKTLATRQPFKTFIAPLKDDTRFFVCGRGVIVNLEHAKDLEGSAFRMADGSRVFVSQDLLKSARQALMEFLLQRGRMA